MSPDLFASVKLTAKVSDFKSFLFFNTFFLCFLIHVLMFDFHVFFRFPSSVLVLSNYFKTFLPHCLFWIVIETHFPAEVHLFLPEAR